MNDDYIDTFEAIATLCERGKRHSAWPLFQAFVQVIRQEQVQDIGELRTAQSTIKVPTVVRLQP